MRAAPFPFTIKYIIFSLVILLNCTSGIGQVIINKSSLDYLKMDETFNPVTNMEYKPIKKIDSLIKAGCYSIALEQIERYLKEVNESDEDIHQRLLMKRYDILTVKHEYTLSRNDVFEKLKKKIPDVSVEDLDKWDKEYSLEYYNIEGEKKYYYNCVYDLFLLNKEAAIRAGENHQNSYDYSKYPLETINRIKNESEYSKKIYVGFSYFQNLDVIPQGGKLRAWIPYVRENKFQQDIKILNSNINDFNLPEKSNLTSMIYFEHQVNTGYNSNTEWDQIFTTPKYHWMYSIKKPEFVTDSTFLIQFVYQYSSKAFYKEIIRDSIRDYNTYQDTYRIYTKETLDNQHTAYLIQLAQKIIRNEENPYIRAKLIYQWICENIVWTDPKPVIGDLAEYTAKYKRGDCNAKSELFISLCRISGIPARSQGGWLIRPNGRHAQHTWAQMYFEPYGWLPVDVTFGRGLINNDDERLKYFHFGNCTPYRLVIYDDDSQILPKKIYPCINGGGTQLGVFQWEGGDLEPFIKIDSYVVSE